MAKRRRYSPEQIITKLREAEFYLSQGKTVGQASKALEINEQTYYRWRGKGINTGQPFNYSTRFRDVIFFSK